jgi:hypothetical protein
VKFGQTSNFVVRSSVWCFVIAHVRSQHIERLAILLTDLDQIRATKYVGTVVRDCNSGKDFVRMKLHLRKII